MDSTRTSPARWPVVVIAVAFFSCTTTYAQEASHDPLEDLNRSLQRLVEKVAPAIVEIETVGYGRPDGDEQSDTRVVAKTENQASGVILDADGYVITNAHVVAGAKRIKVILDDNSRTSQAAGSQRKSQFSARMVGSFEEVDLALLKVEATDLPTLPMASAGSVHPGQLVIAVGSPEGFSNSVSMGVISGTAREDAPDTPLTYIQTDAAINAGSSGGALVDTQGRLVGITTFNITEGGGSEGLGFAVPSAMVQMIYEQLKTQGHIQVGDIGIRIQNITRTLASGLQLPRDSGLVVSDVVSGGPGDKAGIQVQDVLLSLNGRPVHSIAEFAMLFYGKRPGDRVAVELLRSGKQVDTIASVVDRPENSEDWLAGVDTRQSMVSQVGAVCLTLNDPVRSSTPGLRTERGVLVAAKILHSDVRTGLLVGDVIRSVNSKGVESVEQLRTRLESFNPGDPIVLQIERHGKMKFLSFELD